jgi:acetylornithine deacetylase/succinyl-diaminopimelate desuccinylase-like protein
MTIEQQLDAWIDAHFDEEVRFLQELVRVPTDTPPGNNAPHAERTAELLAGMGLIAEKHAVPQAEVEAAGLQTITNLIVRRPYGAGKTIALNAHGDVVPPGEGWTHDPYGGEIVDGKIYGRATAVSKCDIASFTFAIRALESLNAKLAGSVELHVTYDEEYGGEVGPDWLLKKGLTQPDLMIAAGFSYQVVVAHNGCLQLEVTVHGDMAHAAIPDSGTDALQGATHILNALYALNADYLKVTSNVEGITHPYLNEASLRRTIEQAAASFQPPRGGKQLKVDVRRILLARAMKPLAGNQPLVQAIQKHGQAVFGEAIPAVGTPLYTDVRLYVERGIPGVIYGAGPRTVRESNAKRADEHLQLDDLKRATQVIARSLFDLLQPT